MYQCCLSTEFFAVFLFSFICFLCCLFELLSFGVHCSFECWVWGLSSCSFLQVFHCSTFLLSRLSQSHHPTIVAAICFCELFMKNLCVLAVWLCSSYITSEPDFSYLKGLCGLMFCFLAVFCKLNTPGRWSLPCGVRIFILSHGAILGEIRAKSSCVPMWSRHVGNGVVTGLNSTSPKASSRAFTWGLLPCGPTCLTPQFNC